MVETRIDVPHTQRSRSRDELERHIAEVADHGYGVLERAWLLEVGLTPARLRRWLDQGRLRETAFRGIYVLGHLAFVPGQREALALAASGPDAALAGVSSGAWHRVLEPFRGGPVHVLVPPGRGGDLPGIRRSCAAVPPTDLVVVRRLRCTTLERTTMDLPSRHLRQAMQELLRRGVELEPLVERMHGKRGALAFRAEAAQLIPQLAHTMSELEARFVRLCRRYGIPLPVVTGTLVRGDLLDCTWPGSRLVVELDGRRWHQHRDREDRRRDRERTLDGWVPLRFDWWDVTRHEERTARETTRGLRL